ncbi:MAG: DUF1631 family protein [Comamonadaceae bacterium]|nr:DUF1631 family protein [Comamonadaceae bacterium]
MIAPASSAAPHARLARQVRERFVIELDRWLSQLVTVLRGKLAEASEVAAKASDLRLAMDAGTLFKQHGDTWSARVRQAWRQALPRVGLPGDTGGTGAGGVGFALVDDEVVENKILASRLSLAVTDKGGAELNDLRVRMQRLERLPDLPARDVLRPELLSGILVEEWLASGLSREMWALVHDSVRTALAQAMATAYRHANQFLVENGVMPQIDLKSLVRRTAGGGGGGASGPGALPDPAEAGWRSSPAGLDETGYGGGYGAVGSSGMRGGAGSPGGSASPMARHGFSTGSGRASPSAGMMPAPGRAPSSLPGGAAYLPSNARYEGYTGMEPGTATHGGSEEWQPSGMVHPSALARAAEETRMLTAGTPMMRMRARAQGVLGQLRRLLTDRVADFDPSHPVQPSPRLARALAAPVPPFEATTRFDPATQLMTEVVEVTEVAGQLRSQAAQLKSEANTPSEKAIIEIVALMFQAILAEERIAASVRVWFARLQIPVLRLALAEPDFFSSTQHPARQLIDRMGACAMGFDATGISEARLEREIKRIVQVIEQYPETGRRVYQLVLEEFRKFLGRSLMDGSAAQRVATLAQQVEQKETLAIQYTIELNKMLAPLPVRPEVREFLFRIWSEVLALAAVRHGAQGEQTLAFKRAASDLLWAVSAKPNRADRARVLQDLPHLLHTLREGMGTLGLPTDAQDMHIKVLNDTVADAFMARTEVIDPAVLEALGHSLAALEDVVSDDAAGDVMLDPGTIEMMLGVDAGDLNVIASGGSLPSPGTLAWVRELELGAWFGLEQGGHVIEVQYVWRSARGQLHLFAGGGKSHLVQTRRLAAYLQAGLLAPVEDESLTVRATRDALARLDAEPARLMN